MNRLTLAAIVLGASALLAAGCGASPPAPAHDNGPDPEPTATATATATDTDTDFDTFMGDVNGMLDGYWSAALPAEFGVAWQPLAAMRPYDPNLPETVPTCGGEPLEAQNAFYCSEDDALSYDHDFLEDFYEEVGDAAPALIVAHEYGHAVGARLGTDGENSWVVEELADCRAGAFMGEMARQDALETGDAEEIEHVLVELGDDSPDRHEADGGHGSADERVAAYQIGFDGGPGACTAGAS